uniref:Deoxycytidine kinase n=1 Tax=Homo sapiens TaxID=9606 RepID=D6RG38_HUMAN
MATPPKRSCPSFSASSEGTRIKKISIEGNIGKEPPEMWDARLGCRGSG